MKNNKIYTGAAILNIIISLCVLLYSLLFYFESFNNLDNWIFFNSDNLYVFSVINDMVKGGNLSNWNFTPAPYFFPDMPVMLMSYFITPEAKDTLFIYGVFQVIAVIGILAAIFRLVSHQFSWQSISLIILSLSLLFFANSKSSYIDFSYYIFSNGFHFGNLLNTLLSLYFLLRIMKYRRLQKGYLLFLIVPLATFSDSLFLLSFILPLLVILAHVFIQRGEKLKVTFLATIICLAQAAIIKLIEGLIINKARTQIQTGFQEIKNSSKKWMSEISSWLSKPQELDTHLLSLLICFLFLVVLVYFIRQLRSINKNSLRSSYLLFILCSSVLYITAPILMAKFRSIDHFRYQVGGLYLIFFQLPYLINELSHKYLNRKKYLLSISLLSLSLFGICIFKYNSDIFKLNKVDYYPTYIQFIDSMHQKGEFKNGISSYWYAKPSTFYSQSDVEVTSVYNNLKPSFNSINKKQPFKGIGEERDTLKYNFIIEAGLNTNKIKEIFDSARVDTYQYNGMKFFKVPDFYFDRKNNELIPVD